MFATVFLACAVLVCLYALTWLRGRKRPTHLPSYPTLPILGNMHQIMGDSKYLFKKVCELSKLMEDANAPFVGWMGPLPFIFVANPEDVKAVTNAFVDKPYYYAFAREIVGNSLLTAPGDIWKRSIKKLGGTFTGSVVEGYQEVFNAQAQRLVRRMHDELGKEPFDAVNKYLALTTLECICQTSLGTPSTSNSFVTSEYYTAFVDILELLAKRLRNLLLHLDWVYRLTPNYRAMKKSAAVINNATNQMMVARRKEREELKAMGVSPEYNLVTGKTRFKAFIDILFDLQDLDPTLTDEQITAEIATIIVGGQETVATTIFMALLMMGCKPDVQEKVYAEIKKIFGDSKRTVEKDDLEQMKYLEAVIHETLRMYPPIPVVARLADHELQLKDCLIENGTVCAINLYGAGRSKHIWGSDADIYRPERWFAEDCPALVPSNFLAFSYGKRSCIGKRYAMPIMKTILTHCIREFRFKSDADNLQLKIDVSLKADSGHLMTVHLRE